MMIDDDVVGQTWKEVAGYSIAKMAQESRDFARRQPYLMEYVRANSEDLRPEIGLGLGVVDVKRTEVESADEIARAIERAQKTLGPGRVKYVHPDCGFWMLRRNMADGKIRALVQGRDLFEGRNPI